MDTFLVVIIIMSALLIICMMLAAKIAKIIVKPINDVDLENPDVDEHYVELSPLLHKINKQNKQIKKNMSDLKRKQKEFNLITQNMDEGILIIDGKGEVLSYNNAILRLCNIKVIKDNVIAYTLNRNKNFTNVIDAAISGDKIEETIHSNGRVYCAITNPISKKKKSIEKSGAVIIFLDVTEKEHRDQLRREFTSNVSHELKTPLTTIYGVADMLSSGLIKSEDVASFGKDIYNEADRMITLINDIIKLSSLDEGAVEEDLKKSVDIMSVCKRVISRLTSKAASHGITLKISGETDCVFGVESMLEEIFYNLTDNAIKYNNENGYVDITVSRMSHQDKKFIEIIVMDNGIGIPAEQCERIFERFFRVDKSHSRKIGGTGLGLSIVKHAVAYHGGEIEVDSEENKGTTMTVILPVIQ